MTPSISRSIRIVMVAFFGLLVLGLVASAWLTFREGRRLAREQEMFGRWSEFHRVHVMVTRQLVQLGQGGGDAQERREVARELDQLETLSLDSETANKVDELRQKVEKPAPREVLYESIVAFQEVGLRQRDTEAKVLHQLQRDALAQLQMEIAIPLTLILLGLVLYPVARRRVLKPLDAFGHQLSRVGEGDFTPAPTTEVDPLLLPLHRRFNELVSRLRELEEKHEARAHSLEEEVRIATRALLEQQRSLANAERLAATGELAATVAHELRNPLAGIQMTLHNLRAEIADPELVERVDRVVHEVERLTRLLNQLLDSSRHAPEAPREVKFEELIGDLLELTRHQLPAGIKLEKRVDGGLACRLPADRLRQALLNLVLNSAAALGDSGTIIVAAARAGEKVRIDVGDDGPGFASEILESGIRPFLSTRQSGTGLGLAVTRRFARDVGGDVTLSNRSPQGALVTLLLPCNADHL